MTGWNFPNYFVTVWIRKQEKVTEWDYTVTEREHPNYLWPDGITLKYLWPNGNIQTFYDWTELHCARMGTLELFVTGWNYFSTVCDWMELEWLNGINTPTFVTGWEFSLLFIKPFELMRKLACYIYNKIFLYNILFLIKYSCSTVLVQLVLQL